MKKLLALLMAALMLFSFAACGGNGEEETTTNPEEITTEAPANADDVTEEATEEAETEVITEVVTDEEGNTEIVTEVVTKEEKTEKDETTKKNETTKTSDTAKDPSKWSKQEIIDFYKAAAKKSDNDKTNCTQVMTLTKLDGGEGAIGGLISAVEPIAKSALSDSSTPFTGITGGHENLVASDAKSAKAYKSGNYTVIEMTMVEQKDGVNGVSHNGTVGHAISVLDGVDGAIKKLDPLVVDYSQGEIALRYKNPTLKVKIDENGYIVKGTWSYTVNVTLSNVKAAIAIFNVTLNGTEANIDYVIKTGGGF